MELTIKRRNSLSIEIKVHLAGLTKSYRKQIVPLVESRNELRDWVESVVPGYHLSELFKLVVKVVAGGGF